MSKIFSFFSGLGLLDLGFELQGDFQTVFINEKDSVFLKSYLSNRKKMDVITSNEDIEKLHPKGRLGGYLSELVSTEKDKGVVGFIGGPPCPDFSVGGKNRGRKGDNGILSKTYAELIIEQKPTWFMFENVKGLWRTKKHRSFYEELKSDFISSGYILCDRLVNALSYGVPQDRERITPKGCFSPNYPESSLAIKSLGERGLHKLACYPKSSQNIPFFHFGLLIWVINQMIIL